LLVPYGDIEYKQEDKALHVHVKNAGLGPAVNITLECIWQLYVLSTGEMPVLAAGDDLDLSMEPSRRLDKSETGDDMPHLTVTYRDSFERMYTTRASGQGEPGHLSWRIHEITRPE